MCSYYGACRCICELLTNGQVDILGHNNVAAYLPREHFNRDLAVITLCMALKATSLSDSPFYLFLHHSIQTVASTALGKELDNFSIQEGFRKSSRLMIGIRLSPLKQNADSGADQELFHGGEVF